MNLSLDWFKSKRKQELESLKVEEQSLKNKLLEKEIEKAQGDKTRNETAEEKYTPYKSLKLINDTLTIVLNDGSLLTKPGATVDDFKQVKDAASESDVLDVISSEEAKVEKKKEEKEEKEAEKVKKVRKGLKHLKKIDDFKVKDNSVYLKGTNRTLPEMLVNEFSKIISYYFDSSDEDHVKIAALKTDAEYQGLKNFFLWCCLNPRAEVADDLYGFLHDNSFKITKQGFFVALRNVVSLPSESGENKEVVDIISNGYQKVKAVWKHKPENYFVRLDDKGKYTISKTGTTGGPNPSIGNLEKLYLNLPNMKENRFTDDYTRKFDIRIGKPVNMPMEECNWSRADCMSAGLHFTSDEIHYVGCGDTSVLVLINPMKVVGIGDRKGRCYEYLPIMTVPRDEATKLLHDLDFDTLELDEDYAIRELEKLDEKVKAGFKAETTKYQFNLPGISTKEVSNIITSLSKMKKVLSKRVSSIK